MYHDLVKVLVYMKIDAMDKMLGVVRNFFGWLKLRWQCVKWGHIYRSVWLPRSNRPYENIEVEFAHCRHCDKLKAVYVRDYAGSGYPYLKTRSKDAAKYY